MKNTSSTDKETRVRSAVAKPSTQSDPAVASKSFIPGYPVALFVPSSL